MTDFNINDSDYNLENFPKMRAAGKLAAEVLDYITDYVKPGITTLELNDLCHEFIIKNNAIPAPLNYKGFPKSICTSINHVVCHGIPCDKKLMNGDIINIDVTVILDGWYGDTSRMYYAGKPSIAAKRLVEATYNAMMASIAIVKPGLNLYEIGRAIEAYIKPYNYGVVTDFSGHGIGREFHKAPSVLHYEQQEYNVILQPGMMFTIEPMINIGKPETKTLADDWTAVTRDRSLSAQFEHTIGVTETGYEIFTLSPKNFTCPPYNA